MAKAVEHHDFTTDKGKRIRVALLDNGGVRVSFRNQTAYVTWRATSPSPGDSSTNTIITPAVR